MMHTVYKAHFLNRSGFTPVGIFSRRVTRPRIFLSLYALFHRALQNDTRDEAICQKCKWREFISGKISDVGTSGESPGLEEVD